MAHAHPSSPAAAGAAHTGIRSGAIRAVVVTAGALVCICVAVPALGFLASTRGVGGPTMLDATNPLAAAAAVAAVLLCCTAVACLAGRLINAAVGLFVLGCGVALLSMRTGTILDAGFDNDSLRTIAFETLGWSGVVAVLSAVVFRVSGPLPDMPAMDAKGPYLREAVNSDALRGLLSGVAAVAVVWLLMRNDLKGQALGSAVFAGVATALAGRKLQGAAQPILLMAAPVLFIGLAQLWTAFAKTEPIDQLVAAQALPGWSRIMPLDVAAGALVGVPLGLGWSRSSSDE